MPPPSPKKPGSCVFALCCAASLCRPLVAVPAASHHHPLLHRAPPHCTSPHLPSSSFFRCPLPLSDPSFPFFSCNPFFHNSAIPLIHLPRGDNHTTQTLFLGRLRTREVTDFPCATQTRLHLGLATSNPPDLACRALLSVAQNPSTTSIHTIYYITGRLLYCKMNPHQKNKVDVKVSSASAIHRPGGRSRRQPSCR